jgi:hypothetical protein
MMNKIMGTILALSITSGAFAQKLSTRDNDSTWLIQEKDASSGCQLDYLKDIRIQKTGANFTDQGSPLAGALIGQAIWGTTAGLVGGALGLPVIIHGSILGIEALRDHAQLRALAILDFADYTTGSKVVPTENQTKELVAVPAKGEATRQEIKLAKRTNREIKAYNREVIKDNKEMKAWIEATEEEFNELLKSVNKKSEKKLSLEELAQIISDLNAKRAFCSSYAATEVLVEAYAMKKGIPANKLSEAVTKEARKLGSKAYLGSDRKITKYVKAYLTL